MAEFQRRRIKKLNYKTTEFERITSADFWWWEKGNIGLPCDSISIFVKLVRAMLLENFRSDYESESEYEISTVRAMRMRPGRDVVTQAANS